MKPKIVSKEEFKELFGSESEDLEMDSEEPVSVVPVLAPATKDMDLSPTEEKLQKLEILLGKVAEHVGLVEDESSSEDAESDYGGSVVLEEPASSPTKRKSVEDQSQVAKRPRMGQHSSEFFFHPSSKETKSRFEIQQIIDYSIPDFYKELNKSDISEIKNDICQPNIPNGRNYFCPPLLNNSIHRAANKAKESKGIIEGDKILSCIQNQIVTSSFPLLRIWQQLLSGEKDMSMEEVAGALQRSIVLMGSTFAGVSSFRRYRFKRVPKHDFTEICKVLNSLRIQNPANFRLVMI